MSKFSERDINKYLSLLLSSTLENFGFNRDAVSFRANIFGDDLSEICSLSGIQLGLPARYICAGSKSEGSTLKDSDNDLMIIFTDTVCVHEGDFSNFLNILWTDYTDTPPGYTKVEFIHLCSDTKLECLLSASVMYRSLRRNPYISSTVFRNMGFQILNELHRARYDDIVFDVRVTSNGPANTADGVLLSEIVSFDFVLGFYHYGKYLSQRMERARCNDWPPDPLVKEISEMEGFVVPVGMKESENVNIEWRVCFTTAERKLIESFNDTQMKLYVLLKIMAKHIRRECKPFTSYIVKNVVFWVVAGSAQNLFSPESLIFLVKKSLWFIKHCLHNNFLPNYMIPERNMLIGAFSKDDKWDLGKLVSKYLDGDIFSCILNTNIKLNKCASYMFTYPYFVNLYGQWRDKVERLVLTQTQHLCKHYNIQMFTRTTLLSDWLKKILREDQCTMFVINMFNLLVPDWFLLVMSGESEEMTEKYMQRIQFLEML